MEVEWLPVKSACFAFVNAFPILVVLFSIVIDSTMSIMDCFVIFDPNGISIMASSEFCMIQIWNLFGNIVTLERNCLINFFSALNASVSVLYEESIRNTISTGDESQRSGIHKIVSINWTSFPTFYTCFRNNLFSTQEKFFFLEVIHIHVWIKCGVHCIKLTQPLLIYIFNITYLTCKSRIKVGAVAAKCSICAGAGPIVVARIRVTFINTYRKLS